MKIKKRILTSIILLWYFLSYLLSYLGYIDRNIAEASSETVNTNGNNTTALIAVLIDEETYNSVSISSYTSYVSSKYPNSKVVILPLDTEEYTAPEIAKLLENMYFDWIENKSTRLVWVIIMWKIPLPVISYNNYYFPSVYPYVDFLDQKYIWDEKEWYFIQNAENGQAEIWHWLISFETPDEYADFFAKVLEYDADPKEFIDKQIWYEDFIAEKKNFLDDNYQPYQNRLIFAEDLMYHRYTTLLAWILQGKQDQNVTNLLWDLQANFAALWADTSAISTIDDSAAPAEKSEFTPTKFIEQTIWNYLREYQDTLSQVIQNTMADNIKAADRYKKTDTLYQKVRLKDQLLLWNKDTNWILRTVNEALEKFVDEKVEKEKYAMKTVVPIYYLQHKDEAKHFWKTYYVPVYKDTYNFFYFGKNAELIEDPVDFSIYRWTYRNLESLDWVKYSDIIEDENNPAKSYRDQTDITKKWLWASYDVFSNQIEANRAFNVLNIQDELWLRMRKKIHKEFETVCKRRRFNIPIFPCLEREYVGVWDCDPSDEEAQWDCEDFEAFWRRLWWWASPANIKMDLITEPKYEFEWKYDWKSARKPIYDIAWSINVNYINYLPWWYTWDPDALQPSDKAQRSWWNFKAAEEYISPTRVSSKEWEDRLAEVHEVDYEDIKYFNVPLAWKDFTKISNDTFQLTKKKDWLRGKDDEKLTYRYKIIPSVIKHSSTTASELNWDAWDEAKSGLDYLKWSETWLQYKNIFESLEIPEKDEKINWLTNAFDEIDDKLSLLKETFEENVTLQDPEAISWLLAEELLDEIAELTEDKNTLWSEFNDIITKNYAAQAESFIRWYHRKQVKTDEKIWLPWQWFNKILAQFSVLKADLESLKDISEVIFQKYRDIFDLLDEIEEVIDKAIELNESGWDCGGDDEEDDDEEDDDEDDEDDEEDDDEDDEEDDDENWTGCIWWTGSIWGTGSIWWTGCVWGTGSIWWTGDNNTDDNEEDENENEENEEEEEEFCWGSQEAKEAREDIKKKYEDVKDYVEWINVAPQCKSFQEWCWDWKIQLHQKEECEPSLDTNCKSNCRLKAMWNLGYTEVTKYVDKDYICRLDPTTQWKCIDDKNKVEKQERPWTWFGRPNGKVRIDSKRELCEWPWELVWDVTFDHDSWEIKWKCIKDWEISEEVKAYMTWCWDWIVQSEEWEECDYKNDSNCTEECTKKVDCNMEYYWKIVYQPDDNLWLNSEMELCDTWNVDRFSYNKETWEYNWFCKRWTENTENIGKVCKAYQYWRCESEWNCKDYSNRYIWKPGQDPNEVPSCNKKYHLKKIYQHIDNIWLDKEDDLCQTWYILELNVNRNLWLYKWECTVDWITTKSCVAFQGWIWDLQIQKDKWEECDPNDDKYCSEKWKLLPICNEDYNWKKKYVDTKWEPWLEWKELCKWWNYINLELNEETWEYTWDCEKDWEYAYWCHAKKDFCWDGIFQEDRREECDPNEWEILPLSLYKKNNPDAQAESTNGKITSIDWYNVFEQDWKQYVKTVNKKCDDLCRIKPEYNPLFSWQTKHQDIYVPDVKYPWIIEEMHLCKPWKVINFEYNEAKWIFRWDCERNWEIKSRATAWQTRCWDWIVQEEDWEECEWWDDCNYRCHTVKNAAQKWSLYCNEVYAWKTQYQNPADPWLKTSMKLCKKWKIIGFHFNTNNGTFWRWCKVTWENTNCDANHNIMWSMLWKDEWEIIAPWCENKWEGSQDWGWEGSFENALKESVTDLEKTKKLYLDYFFTKPRDLIPPELVNVEVTNIIKDEQIIDAWNDVKKILGYYFTLKTEWEETEWFDIKYLKIKQNGKVLESKLINAPSGKIDLDWYILSWEPYLTYTLYGDDYSGNEISQDIVVYNDPVRIKSLPEIQKENPPIIKINEIVWVDRIDSHVFDFPVRQPVMWLAITDEDDDFRDETINSAWMNFLTHDRPIDSPRYLSFQWVWWNEIKLIYPDIFKVESYFETWWILMLKETEWELWENEMRDAIIDYLKNKVKEYNYILWEEKEKAKEMTPYYRNLLTVDALATPTLKTNIRPYEEFTYEELLEAIGWQEMINTLAELLYYQSVTNKVKGIYDEITEDIQDTRNTFDLNEKISYIIKNYLAQDMKKYYHEKGTIEDLVIPAYNKTWYEVGYINTNWDDLIIPRVDTDDEIPTYEELERNQSKIGYEERPIDSQEEAGITQECWYDINSALELINLSHWGSDWLKGMQCWLKELAKRPFEISFTFEWSMWDFDTLFTDSDADSEEWDMNWWDTFQAEPKEDTINYSRMYSDSHPDNSDPWAKKVLNNTQIISKNKRISVLDGTWSINFLSFEDYWNLSVIISSTGANCLVVEWTDTCNWKKTITKNPFKSWFDVEFSLRDTTIWSVWINLELCTSTTGKCWKKSISVQAVPWPIDSFEIKVPTGWKILAWAYIYLPIIAYDKAKNEIARSIETYSVYTDKWNLVIWSSEKKEQEINDYLNTNLLFKSEKSDGWIVKFTIKKKSITNLEWETLSTNTAEIVQWEPYFEKDWARVTSLEYDLTDDKYFDIDSRGNMTLNKEKVIPIDIVIRNWGEVLPVTTNAFIGSKKGLTTVANLKETITTWDIKSLKLEWISTLYFKDGRTRVYLVPWYSAWDDEISIVIPWLDEKILKLKIKPGPLSKVVITTDKDYMERNEEIEGHIALVDAWWNKMITPKTLTLTKAGPLEISPVADGENTVVVNRWDYPIWLTSSDEAWVTKILAESEWIQADKTVTVKRFFLWDAVNSWLNIMYLNLFGTDWWNQWWYLSENNKFAENIISKSKKTLAITTQLIDAKKVRKAAIILWENWSFKNLNAFPIEATLNKTRLEMNIEWAGSLKMWESISRIRAVVSDKDWIWLDKELKTKDKNIIIYDISPNLKYDKGIFYTKDWTEFLNIRKEWVYYRTNEVMQWYPVWRIIHKWQTVGY